MCLINIGSFCLFASNRNPTLQLQVLDNRLGKLDDAQARRLVGVRMQTQRRDVLALGDHTWYRTITVFVRVEFLIYGLIRFHFTHVHQALVLICSVICLDRLLRNLVFEELLHHLLLEFLSVAEMHVY